MSTSTSTDNAVPLGGWDLATWRAATADPMFRAPLVALLRLRADPGREELLTRVAKTIPGSVLERQIVMIDGRPHSVPAELDLHRHVIDWTPGADPLGALANRAAALIPQQAPPWCVVRFPGTPAHVALVMDHAIADGRSALSLAAGLLDGWAPPVQVDNGVQARARESAGVRGAVGDAIALSRSLLRLTRVHDRPLSPLMRSRGDSQSWHVMEFPLERLRTAARSAHITVNDALVAAVLRATARHHELHDITVDELRVNVPISLRVRGVGRGNSLAIARTTLPVPHTAELLRHLHDQLVAWRTEPALARVDRLVGAGSLVPVSMLAAAARASDLTISNLGPVSGRATIAGQPVEAVFPLPGTMGVAVSVALLSFGAVGCLGVAIDDKAVTDPDLLISLLGHELGVAADRRGVSSPVGEPA